MEICAFSADSSCDGTLREVDGDCTPEGAVRRLAELVVHVDSQATYRYGRGSNYE